MGIQEMNDNIANRMVQRRIYQQRYFQGQRQLDAIQYQVDQLQEALSKAKTTGNVSLAEKIKAKIIELKERWNNVRKEVR